MSYVSPYEALRSHADCMGSKPAAGVLSLGTRKYEDFNMVSWAEKLDKVHAYGQYLRYYGLKAGDKIGIMGRNQLAWVGLDLAAMACGFVTVPIFPQSSKKDIEYIVNESQLKLLITDCELPYLDVAMMSFIQLDESAKIFEGKNFKPSPLPKDQICTIIYTSGTTGEPKGVMHSAHSIYLASQPVVDILSLSSADRIISYLPLSHVAERVFSEFAALYGGSTVYYIESIEKVSRYLTRVRPTVYLAVPRIWNMIRAKIERELEANPWIRDRVRKIPDFLLNPLLRVMVKRKLGFNKTRVFVSGSAKLPIETAEALDRLGIRITEAYGLTETLCVSTANRPGHEKFGSIGKTLGGAELKIAEDGEILLKAPFHFKGYYKKEEATTKALEDGWFRTGDVGRVDSDGFVYITDRKKDIFKTSNGKYVAPLPIETQLRCLNGVREALVLGDDRPHCVAIVSIDSSEFDLGAFERELQRINNSLAPHEKVYGVGITAEEWSIGEGQLTPSMKLKRSNLFNRYQSKIDGLYKSRRRIEFFEPYEVEKRAHANSSI